MEFTPDALLRKLELPAAARRLWVAFSGGLDSTVLLHAFAARRDVLPAPLNAVHVDHNLNPESPRWADRCQAVCDALDVPLERFAVIVDSAPGASVEAAARDARYEVFRQLLAPDEILLTAQHQDDQLETFLLQALRGAGPHGLAAMPRLARLGQGWLLRPLLDWPRAALEDWAGAQGLAWQDDPSNADDRFDRNYLRRQILPLLKVRWPSAAQTVSRSARHSADAAELADELAAIDLSASGHCDDGGILRVSALLRLDLPRRRNVLRHWLDWLGFPRPSEKKLEHILSDVLEAAPDTEPCVDWADIAVRRYRDGLFAARAIPKPRAGSWQGDVFELGEGWGRLRREKTAEAGLPDGITVEVRFREGGEKIRPLGRDHHHDLRKLFQEAGVLPWRRDAMPLIYVDNTFAAVGNLWVNADIAQTPGWRVAWEDSPRVIAP
ncbi:MAG TPA: tRNA lysidine(34) synthetase TilS [Gammaproteobacteria bacterium]